VSSKIHRIRYNQVCPNQDVAYGAGFTALDKEPTVVQVPDFGDRFYVYALYDQRTDEIGRIGKQYGTKPGFYMIVGPNWKGEIPKGVTAAVRSSTDLVFVVPRVFKEATPEDTAAVQPVIDQIVMYPLSQFDGKMKTKDYSKSPHFPVPPQSPHAAKGESKWVKPETYFDELSEVMKGCRRCPVRKRSTAGSRPCGTLPPRIRTRRRRWSNRSLPPTKNSSGRSFSSNTTDGRWVTAGPCKARQNILYTSAEINRSYAVRYSPMPCARVQTAIIARLEKVIEPDA
jgi:hypothetical protein